MSSFGAAAQGPYPPSYDIEPSSAAAARDAAARRRRATRGRPTSSSSSSAAAPAPAAAPATEFDDNNSYKVYIVLHGQGIRASPESSDVGYVHTGTLPKLEDIPNFYTVPEKTQVFRMVPPGHVFMSHEDINKELRTFFGKNVSKWIQTFKSSATNRVNAKQAAALRDHSSVDPETQTHNRSRAIFNRMLQLFITGDEITNERLETDYDTPESIREFGIWIASPDSPHAFSRLPLYSATDARFLNTDGKAQEVPLGSIIDNIRQTYGEDNFFEFYVANCSPVSQDMSAKKRLVRRSDGTWHREGEYGTAGSSSNFWRNTLRMYVKRIKLYHNGNIRLEQLKERTRRHASSTVLQFPGNDTVWGMMDDEERKDNYKLMNGFLHFYPKWIEAASTPGERTQIKNEMIFYIQCISTPFVEPIRGGSEHQQGISQITKLIPTSGASSSSAAAVTEPQNRYYTLSDVLVKKLAGKINSSKANLRGYNARYIPIYCELLKYIYGQNDNEMKVAYKSGRKKRIINCENNTRFLARGGATRKRRRKRKTRKRKTRNRKTRKKKRRRKKRTKRKK